MFKRTITALKFFFLISVFIFIFKPNVYSIIITPSIFTDEFTAANGNCSLREAVESVNNGSDMHGCSGINPGGEPYGVNDMITLVPGTYVLSLTGGEGGPTNSVNDLDLTTRVIIQGLGAGPGDTIIDGECVLSVLMNGGVSCSCSNSLRLGDRIFDIFASSVEIRRLTITGGEAVNGGGYRFNDAPGGLIEDVIVKGNLATSGKWRWWTI